MAPAPSIRRLCDGFRMTAHLRRCHEHRGRRPKAAKEGKRGEWGTRLSGRLYVADCLANKHILLSSEENGEPVWALGA